MSSEDAAAMPGTDAAVTAVTAVRTCLAHRGYSDSVVANYYEHGRIHDSSTTSTPTTTSSSSTISTISTPHSPTKLLLPCTCDATTPSISQYQALSQRGNFRHNLQLPSFRSLGIGSGSFAGQPGGTGAGRGVGGIAGGSGGVAGALPIGSLPTPPEEPLVDFDFNLPPAPSGFSRSISFTEGIIPTIPTLHDLAPFFPDKSSDQAPLDMTGGPSSIAPTSNPEPSASSASSTGNAKEQAGAGQNTSGISFVVEDPSGGGSETGGSDDNGFITGAIPFTNHTVSSSDLPVLHAMCYIQPCPLEGVETAFNEVLTDMESQASQLGKYIEVTYQMPPRFNINQIPSSPAATPNADQTASDYFSAHVYTRGIVAQTYESAMARSGPSSPRPAVAPGSINVAMLERYIPPSTLDEYTNLFSTDMPSALVDRLFELSPNNGTFIFIYPTAQGAKTFFSAYLRPLLDPLLRTIASTHGHSADLPAAVGALASLNGDLLPFDRIITRLTSLLRKLSRPTSQTASASTPATPRPSPTYTLIHSDCSVVDISKQAIVDWWLEQEKRRIRKAVEQYFHSRRADSTVGMAAMIEEGLRKREYNDYDPERGGVEVGLFVIRRTS